MGTATIDSDAPVGVGADRSQSPTAALTVRWGRRLLDAACLAGALALTWWVGVRTTDFVGPVKGTDAVFHAATVRFLMESWPHLLWSSAWFAGSPSVPGLYPPLYQMMVAAVASAAGTTIEHAMVECCAAAYLVMAASLYGFVRVVAKSRSAAVLAVLLVLAVPGFWAPSLQAGEYPRLTGMAFAALATFFAALYTAKPSRPRFAASVLAIGLALATHPVTGGLGALQVIGVLLLVPYRPFPDRARRAAGAATLMLGLSAWLYLPSLMGVHAYYILPQARLTRYPSPPFGDLLYPGAASPLSALSPIVLPLALLLLAITAFVAWRQRAAGSRRWTPRLGATAAMLVVVACLLAYAYAGRLFDASLSLVGVFPPDMFHYAAWPLAAACALLLAHLLSAYGSRLARWWRLPALAVPYAGATMCLLLLTPVIAGDAINVHAEEHMQAPLLPGSNGTQQYRNVFTNFDESSYEFTRIPELGGPFNQGALNLDYVTWAEAVLTDPSATRAETEFIDQWNAVRWVETEQGLSSVYQHDPGAFRFVGSSRDPSYRNYEYLRSGPILAGTDTPPVLVIGPYANYNLFLRSLALTGVGPSRLIPVEGTSYIDDYSLAQLEQFPVVFLYGFEAHDPAAAAKLLAEYVRAGGGIVAEVGGNAPLAAELAKDGAPLPVRSWSPDELHGSWGFSRSHSPLTRGVDLARFSPATYAGTQPYLVDTARRLAPGSSVVLATGRRPLVAERSAGTGLVLESGMNLPYHDAVFSNAPESSLLARLVSGVTARTWVRGAPRGGGAVLANDSDLLRVGSSDGVLFKETDTPDWQATVNGQPATIYPAGPGYMYIRLGATSGRPATVLFRYHLSLVEWGSIVLSVLTLLLLGAYLLEARLPRRARREERRDLRETLRSSLDGYNPAVQQAALALLVGQPLEPYADLLIRFTLLDLDPGVLAALVRLVEEGAMVKRSSDDLAALREWASRQHREQVAGFVGATR